MEFLLSALGKVSKAQMEFFGAEQTLSTLTSAKGNSIAESISFLLSRNRVWKRWVMNYKERTTIRINLYFNLASQNTADLTSQIAVETQKDSSSMITCESFTLPPINLLELIG